MENGSRRLRELLAPFKLYTGLALVGVLATWYAPVLSCVASVLRLALGAGVDRCDQIPSPCTLSPPAGVASGLAPPPRLQARIPGALASLVWLPYPRGASRPRA